MSTENTQPKRKSRSLEEAYEKHKTSNNDFFTLKDDGDEALVRFLYTNKDELDWFVVHEVEMGGKKRWVECTEEPDCPCCLKLGRPTLKLFIQMMQKGKADTVVTFERGQKFIPIMVDLFEKFGDLTQHQFEIVRRGKAGDSNTSYEINHIQEAPVSHDKLEDRQIFLGEDGFILQKSHEQMKEILSGNFQNTSVAQSRASARPRSSARPTNEEVF